MLGLGLGLPQVSTRGRTTDPLLALIDTLFGQGEQGGLYIAKAKFAYQDAAGTVPATTDGDPVGLVISQQGDANASSATPTDQTYGIDGSYTYIDHTTGSLSATLPDLGTAATVCIVSLNGIEYQDGLTISGATTLPLQEWDAVLYRDAAFTPAEQEIIASYFKGYGHRTLSLDFAAQSYAIGDRPIEDVQRLLTVERATPKWVYSASGKLTEVPANQPAYQHDPVTGEPQGLLIEESRTNLLTGSESAWGSWYHGGSAYFNERVSEDSVPWMGNVDVAFYGPEAGVNSFSTSASFYNVGILDVGEYCLTGLFKYRDPNGLVGSPTMRSLHRAIGDSSGSGGSNVARLFGAGGSHGSSSSSGSGIFGEARIVESRPVGNDWYYYVERFEIVEAGQVQLRLFPYNAGGSFTGDGETGILRTRLQLEKGSTPSSYIKTEDAPVTRAADNVSRELGDEFNPSEGTLYAEFYPGLDNNANQLIFGVSDGTSSNRTLMRHTYADQKRIQFLSVRGGVISSRLGVDVLVEGLNKVALSYNQSGWTLAVNGYINILSDVTGDVIATTAHLSNAPGSFQDTSSKKEVRYYPRALSEQELIDLTS